MLLLVSTGVTTADRSATVVVHRRPVTVAAAVATPGQGRDPGHTVSVRADIPRSCCG